MSSDNNNTSVEISHDWDFEINVSGLVAPTGKALNMPEGYYKFEIVDMYTIAEKNPNRVIIKLKVAEGDFKGLIRSTGLNRPTSPEDKVRYYWRALAEAAGHSPIELDKGNIKLGPKAFKGRVATAHFIPKEEGNEASTYEQVNFLAPLEWDQQKDTFAAISRRMTDSGTGNAVTTGNGAQSLGGNTASSITNLLGSSKPSSITPSSGSPLNAEGTVDKGSLLSKLQMN